MGEREWYRIYGSDNIDDEIAYPISVNEDGTIMARVGDTDKVVKLYKDCPGPMAGGWRGVLDEMNAYGDGDGHGNYPEE
jgi:hypothetical protein